MTKLESKLTVPWIDMLRRECSNRHEHIKLVKIHGGAYQVMGISDYLGWYKGIGLAIEFKVHPNTTTPIQQDFLDAIARTSNVAMIVTFKKGCPKEHPYDILQYAIGTPRLFKVEVGW